MERPPRSIDWWVGGLVGRSVSRSIGRSVGRLVVLDRWWWDQGMRGKASLGAFCRAPLSVKPTKNEAEPAGGETSTSRARATCGVCDARRGAFCALPWLGGWVDPFIDWVDTMARVGLGLGAGALEVGASSGVLSAPASRGITEQTTRGVCVHMFVPHPTSGSIHTPHPNQPASQGAAHHHQQQQPPLWSCRRRRASSDATVCTHAHSACCLSPPSDRSC